MASKTEEQQTMRELLASEMILNELIRRLLKNNDPKARGDYMLHVHSLNHDADLNEAFDIQFDQQDNPRITVKDVPFAEKEDAGLIPLPGFDRLLIEIVREHNGRVESAGILTTPAEYYCVGLDNGELNLVLHKGRVTRMLQDHKIETVLRKSEFGDSLFAVITVPRQLLLDNAEWQE